jgi:hypothetical protein
MRKLLTLVPFALVALFTMSLALADDSAKTSDQQPGTTSDSATTEKSKSSDQAMKDQFKDWKTCTDSAGVTYKRDQKGFEACIQEKMDQMSGETGGEGSQPGTSGSMDSSGSGHEGYGGGESGSQSGSGSSN